LSGGATAVNRALLDVVEKATITTTFLVSCLCPCTPWAEGWRRQGGRGDARAAGSTIASTSKGVAESTKLAVLVWQEDALKDIADVGTSQITRATDSFSRVHLIVCPEVDTHDVSRLPADGLQSDERIIAFITCLDAHAGLPLRRGHRAGGNGHIADGGAWGHVCTVELHIDAGAVHEDPDHRTRCFGPLEGEANGHRVLR